MAQHRNIYNHPIGRPLPDWRPATHPGHIAMTGRYARLEPLDADRHGADLFSASRRAAERLGFTYEGVFRQALAYKGRNRDTARYSMFDSEWPAIERAFQAWLDPKNFKAGGAQKLHLGDLIAAGSRQA